MGEINNIVCNYLGLPGYYADFWNGTVFCGKRKIKIWQLQRHDREYYKQKNKKGKTGNVRRDVQMHCKGKKKGRGKQGNIYMAFGTRTNYSRYIPLDCIEEKNPTMVRRESWTCWTWRI